MPINTNAKIIFLIGKYVFLSVLYFLECKLKIKDKWNYNCKNTYSF